MNEPQENPFAGVVPTARRPEPTPNVGAPVLDVMEYAASRRHAATADACWLIRGKWPGDAYGIIGAEDKAGKTFAVADLAVSVVTGTPWFGGLAVDADGPATMFLGEGGERGMVRRLDAIARSRGVDRDLAGLRVCYRVPRLASKEHLAAFAAEVGAHPPRLVIVDPLYLAAAGARGSDLYGMGDLLGEAQRICQDAGAALAITTHWNKTGEGTGASRFTGVGPGAWGRVLASAAVEQRRVEDGRSVVLLRWGFTGGEIADSTVRVRRTVWAESDALDSPLHYEVEVTDEEDGLAAAIRAPSKNQGRVLLSLAGSTRERPATTAEVQDRVAQDGQGPPLKTVTIRKILNDLVPAGPVDGEDDGEGTAKRWWLT